jgi:hypothetical protein
MASDGSEESSDTAWQSVVVNDEDIAAAEALKSQANEKFKRAPQ